MYPDSELSFLSSLADALEEDASATQRGIARMMGVSAGLVNLMVSRLVREGLVEGERVDGRRMRYRLTAGGAERAAEYGRERMRGRFREMREYAGNVARHLGQARFDGARRVVLYGESELKFLLEYACGLYGMEFAQEPYAGGVPADIPAGTYAVLGDDVAAGPGGGRIAPPPAARNVRSVYELVG